MELAEMVKSVNQSVLQPGEILADGMFEYRSKNDTLVFCPGRDGKMEQLTEGQDMEAEVPHSGRSFRR